MPISYFTLNLDLPPQRHVHVYFYYHKPNLRNEHQVLQKHENTSTVHKKQQCGVSTVFRAFLQRGGLTSSVLGCRASARLSVLTLREST